MLKLARKELFITRIMLVNSIVFIILFGILFLQNYFLRNSKIFCSIWNKIFINYTFHLLNYLIIYMYNKNPLKLQMDPQGAPLTQHQSKSKSTLNKGL